MAGADGAMHDSEAHAMHEKFTTLTPELYAYLVEHNPRPDPVLRDLARETAALGEVSIMQVSVEQGAFLTLLGRIMGARRAVEVGTFTGYSAICMARGLANDGRLLCCDVNEEWTAIARRYLARAGLADRVDLRLAPALETLRMLPRAEEIDLSFIDADKVNYRAYYEELLARTRPNGIILFDNVLWSGDVINPEDRSESTEAIRALNDFLRQDDRVDVVMLPISDGLTIARKR